MGPRFLLAAAFLAPIFPCDVSAHEADGTRLVILVFNLERTVAESETGQTVTRRLEELMSALRKDTDAARTSLQREFQTLEEQRSLLAPEVFRSRINDLRSREDSTRTSLSARVESIRKRGEEAGGRILKSAEKALSDIARQRKADLVLRHPAVFHAKPDMDVTDELIASVDADLDSTELLRLLDADSNSPTEKS